MWKAEKQQKTWLSDEKNEKQIMYVNDAKLFFRPQIC